MSGESVLDVGMVDPTIEVAVKLNKTIGKRCWCVFRNRGCLMGREDLTDKVGRTWWNWSRSRSNGSRG